jgi:polysaccharide biosynthesis PFTS motif protein
MYFKVIKKRYIRRLRGRLKGAKLLRNNKNPFLVAKVISNLSSVSLNIDTKKIPHYLVGNHANHAEALLRQILLKKYERMCSELMYSIGTGENVRIALPYEWISVIEQHGFNVSHFGSKIKLFKYSFFCLFKGVRQLLQVLAGYNSYRSVIEKTYVVFLELYKTNLPLHNFEKKYDIISWYKNYILNHKNIAEIWAVAPLEKKRVISPNICVTKGIFPKYGSLIKLIIFVCRVTATFILALFGILRGRWWYGFLYEESILLSYVTLCNDDKLAKEYLFHNSSWFYKPLWTYDVELRGASVSLYYYSTNIEAIEFGNYKTVNYGIDVMRWNKVLVWDRQQKEYLKKFNNKAEYQIVGTIDFSDGAALPDINYKKFNIAVFDVTPTRVSFYTSLGYALAPYYSKELVTLFYLHIINVMTGDNINLLLKHKRNVDANFIATSFIKKQKLITKESFKIIESDISASRLVENVDAIISLPYTATSIIGKNIGKPAIYYDPSGTILKTEHHGIPVLKSIDELAAWKQSILG